MKNQKTKTCKQKKKSKKSQKIKKSTKKKNLKSHKIEKIRKKASKENNPETADGSVIPFGAKVSYKPISSKDVARLHQCGKEMLPGIRLGYVSRARRGWSGDLLTADCEDPENLTASDSDVKRFEHWEVAPEGKLLFFVPVSKKKRMYFWSMTLDFTYRHHEAHRTMLYVEDETSLSIPSKYVDVMRPTKTSIDNASEHTLNDYWNDGREDLLSKEWIVTTRCRLLRIKLPDEYKWVNGRPTKVQRQHDMSRSGQKNVPDKQTNKPKWR